MSIIATITNKWPQLLVLLGIFLVIGGAAWISLAPIVQGTTPMAPLMLLALGMMPFLVGLEELANRRKTQRLAFHKR